MNIALGHLKDLQTRALETTLGDESIAQDLTEVAQRIDDVTNCVKCLKDRPEHYIF